MYKLFPDRPPRSDQNSSRKHNQLQICEKNKIFLRVIRTKITGDMVSPCITPLLTLNVLEKTYLSSMELTLIIPVATEYMDLKMTLIFLSGIEHTTLNRCHLNLIPPSPSPCVYHFPGLSCT